MARSQNYLVGLVQGLIGLGGETEWIEFKLNNSDPKEIGRNISALANGAALHNKPFGYLLWGIEDGTWRISGTSFKPGSKKVGNEPLENWLSRHLDPKIQLHFHEVKVDGRTVVLLEIERAAGQPVRFYGNDYVRVGQVTKPMKESPDRERELWLAFNQIPFEKAMAAQQLEIDKVFELLDYPAYFDLLGTPIPENRRTIIKVLSADDIICPCDAGGWDITNLGAVLLAKDLREFPSLKRKIVRVIRYEGNDRLRASSEINGTKGYANGFEELVSHVRGILPQRETIDGGLRRKKIEYPEYAVRELIVNMLVHQDFSVSGTGPMVEIFDARVEFTNAGNPLVDTVRFLDMPPRSRNENVAGLMRRFGLCEERGSGIDRVVSEVEAAHLPAPLFEEPGKFTRSVLFAPRDLLKMDRRDRVRACYLHACLCFIGGRDMNNATLRERFGVADGSVARISQLLREAMDEGMIVVRDPTVGRRHRCYVPFWAVSTENGFEFSNTEGR